MGNIFISVRLYKKNTDKTWATTYTEIPLSSIDLKKGIEANKDTFSFKLFNTNKIYKNTFDVSDKLALYVYKDKESPEDDDLVLDGLITKIQQTITTKGRIMTIYGANRTQYLLGALVRLNLIGEGYDSRDAIVEIINKVNNVNQAYPDSNAEFKINYSNDTVVTTKKDGSAFPEKSFTVTYKSAYEAISQFSKDEYTGDGDYIFWIDNIGYLHWTYKTDDVSYNFIEGTTLFEDITIEQGTWDSFNAVVASVGRDCYNHGNHILQYNSVSMAENGTKWKFLNYDSISSELITKEIQENKTLFNIGDDGTPSSNFPTSYPYTMQFKEINSDYQELSNLWTVNNDNQYNTAIRRKSRLIGKQKVSALLASKGEVNYKISFTVNGTNSYTLGALCNVTIDSQDIQNEQFRITDIQHRVDTNGWMTSISLEQEYNRAS